MGFGAFGLGSLGSLGFRVGSSPYMQKHRHDTMPLSSMREFPKTGLAFSSWSLRKQTPQKGAPNPQPSRSEPHVLQNLKPPAQAPVPEALPKP